MFRGSQIERGNVLIKIEYRSGEKGERECVKHRDFSYLCKEISNMSPELAQASPRNFSSRKSR